MWYTEYMSKAPNPCDNYESCQEPKTPTSVCFHCGFLKGEHKSYTNDQVKALISMFFRLGFSQGLLNSEVELSDNSKAIIYGQNVKFADILKGDLYQEIIQENH